ncbi:DEAD/DEAH box helicase [Halobacteriovorax marinus]|uniref:DEAD/DEAH box helicase n=1 Tax=Halobacteriovorax marinus TaxID=97084 RepID=A0A1Y5FIN8_9BACT|nr:DEAD/DEAH box helicase [Halobacteriovorax marinus]
MTILKDFNSLKLLPSILEQVEKKGYTTPTPIQAQSIPHLLKGRDLLGIAKTGSGKTAAFSIPILDRFGRKNVVLKPNQVRSLILTPTRELATQIEKNITTYGEGLELSSKVVFGGVGRQPQIKALEGGLDVLVATPGRLLDLINCGHVGFEQLEVFVLDEADMMLDMGFLKDVKSVISFLPIKNQTLLFSATMPPAIEKLSKELLINPIKVKVDLETSTVDTVIQKVYALEKKNKNELLETMLADSAYSSVLIFCKTKLGGDIIVQHIENMSVSCAAIHSNKSQRERDEALNSFREGEVRVLVATDVAARGIDIKNVSHVINYNLPEDPTNYIHRIGRTGRAGQSGVAISFCVPSEIARLGTIEKLIDQKIEIDADQPFHVDFSSITSASKKKKNAKGMKAKKAKGRRF